MKKRHCFIFLCLIRLYAYSFDFKWDIGSVAFGGQVTKEIEPTIDIRILDFNFEFDNGFYAYISPFKYSCIINKSEENNNHSGYFINLGVGYELFKFKEPIQLIPYFETNYLAIEGLKKFAIESGLCFKFFSNNSFSENAEKYRMKGEVVNIKTGIRLQNFKPAYFISVGTDVLNLLMFIWGKK